MVAIAINLAPILEFAITSRDRNIAPCVEDCSTPLSIEVVFRLELRRYDCSSGHHCTANKATGWVVYTFELLVSLQLPNLLTQCDI